MFLIRFMKKEKKRIQSKLKKEYKAVIFDLDGTLINSLPYHIKAFQDLFLEHGFRVPSNRIKHLAGLPTIGILKELKKKYHFKEKLEDLREERRYHYFKFLGRKNIIFPCVENAIKKLKKSYKLGIATGSSRVTFEHSTNRKFQNLFNVIITINDVHKGKPHPDQLLRAAKEMRVKPSECLVVGDSFTDGITAKAAGMDFVGVLTGYTKEKELKKYGAFLVLKSARELPGVL